MINFHKKFLVNKFQYYYLHVREDLEAGSHDVVSFRMGILQREVPEMSKALEENK